jgi:hypothetical protein
MDDEDKELIFIGIILLLIMLGIGGCIANENKTETIIVEDAYGNVVNKIIQPKRYGRCR